MTAASQPSALLPKAGDLIANKYRIERMIGAGGMGAVYVAVHELLRERVAIKVLLPEVVADRDAVTRFINEARNATRIRNEHVAQVKDVDTLPSGVPYMVMEYLDGHDLGQCQRVWGPVPIAPATDYVLQALDALADAHAIGIVHRDLKPANLFLTKQPDGSDIIKVLDFGISKSTDLATPLGADGGVTNTKAVLGSPGYMSPEQIKNARHVDARADIWSMGVILYKLLTNHKPFNGETMGEVFAAIFEETPKPIRSFRPDVPPALEEIVLARCLQRDRDKRFANVGELAAALAPFGLPSSHAIVERIQRRFAAAQGSQISRVGNMTASMPSIGGTQDRSASVSHVSQVSQPSAMSASYPSHVSQVSQASQSYASQSQSSTSQSHGSQSHASQSVSHMSSAQAAGVPASSNRGPLIAVAAVLFLLVAGGAAFAAKVLFAKPDPTPTVETAATTKAPTSETTKAPTTAVATSTTPPTPPQTDPAVPVDNLPTKPSATTPPPAITGTTASTKATTSSGTSPKSSATTKSSSSAPSDDILKMRR